VAGAGESQALTFIVAQPLVAVVSLLNIPYLLLPLPLRARD
jgi:hypothetical protein